MQELRYALSDSGLGSVRKYVAGLPMMLDRRGPAAAPAELPPAEGPGPAMEGRPDAKVGRPSRAVGAPSDFRFDAASGPAEATRVGPMEAREFS